MRRLLAVCVAMVVAALPAAAQDGLGSRPVTLVVPFSPGTSVDIQGRAFAEALRGELGVPAVTVVNRDGASGTIGAREVAQARPDGTTLLFSPSGPIAIQTHLMAGLPYRADGFTPICQAFENAFVIAVRDASPYRTLADLLADARARPEALSWGDVGVATVPNLSARELAQRAGVAMTHVPYRNNAQMIADLRSGRLDFAVPTWANMVGGGLRALAVIAAERQPQAPDVPTLLELGFPITLPGYGGLIAPPGLPAAIGAQLERACLAAAGSEVFRRVSEAAGLAVVTLGREGFARRLAEEHQARTEILRGIAAR